MIKLSYQTCLTLGLLFLLPFSGCKQCKDQNIFTYDHFSDYYYNGLMRFNGKESLTFTKNGADTIVFKGQGLQQYYNELEADYGSCLATYRLLNEKVTFRNSKEGDIVFHYFIASPENSNSQAFELIFKSENLIGQISAFEYYENPYDSNFVFGGKEYEYTKKFTANNGDSIYMNNSTTDYPRRRILRIKFGNNIYDLVP